MQAVRLNDVLNTLTSVPSKMRFLLLDCLPQQSVPRTQQESAGSGLAIVDAKIGAPGTFMSFSTSPGAEAEDGNGANSPYTTALLEAAKAVRTFRSRKPSSACGVAVNRATDGRQTPWDSSSLTEDFRFIGTGDAGPETRRGQEDGRAMDARSEGQAGRGRQRDDRGRRHRRVLRGLRHSLSGHHARPAGTATGSTATAAWWHGTRRCMINTAAGYRAFLALYPDSDLSSPRASWKSGCASGRTSSPRVARRCRTPRSPPVPCGPQPAPQLAAAAEEGRCDAGQEGRHRSAEARQQAAKPIREPEDVVVVRRPPPRVIMSRLRASGLDRDRHRYRRWRLWRRRLWRRRLWRPPVVAARSMIRKSGCRSAETYA